jgi:hypothetical protein
MRNGKSAMTKGERDDLIKLIKQRERAQKTATVERSKELLADFERHLGTIFRYDRNEVWKAATEAAYKAIDKANEEIKQESEKLGIPEEFAPIIGLWRRLARPGRKCGKGAPRRIAQDGRGANYCAQSESKSAD